MKKVLDKVFSSRIGAFACLTAFEMVLTAISYLIWVITKYDINGMTWTEYVMSYITSPTPWQTAQLAIGAVVELVGAEWIYRIWNNTTENA